MAQNKYFNKSIIILMWSSLLDSQSIINWKYCIQWSNKDDDYSESFNLSSVDKLIEITSMNTNFPLRWRNISKWWWK